MKNTEQKIPALRFPEFSGEWEEKRINEILVRHSEPVAVQEDQIYQEIGIRSHGKGIFHKEKIRGEELGNKRVFWIKENAFIVNIVFAWEQAVAKTSESEIGLIASHRFPMYIPIKNMSSVDYLLRFFLTDKGKMLLEQASPGGAGRNKTLGQDSFGKSKLVLPIVSEQQKIADFLSAVDKRLQLLKDKKTKLEEYKRGVMQRIFSQELRFTRPNGSAYPDWEEKRLGEISVIFKGTQLNSENLLAEGEYPVLNGGVSFSGFYDRYNKEAETVTISEGGNSCGYVNLVRTKFWSGGHCYTLESLDINIDKYYLFQYLKHKQPEIMRLRVGSGLPNIQKKDIEIFKINIPHLDEQRQIADFLSAIDNKISLLSKQIESTEQYKKGLLQQMFM